MGLPNLTVGCVIRAFRPFHGRRNCRTERTIHYVVHKFEATDSVNKAATPVRRQKARSSSVRENPKLSTPRRSQEPSADYNLANFLL